PHEHHRVALPDDLVELVPQQSPDPDVRVVEPDVEAGALERLLDAAGGRRTGGGVADEDARPRASRHVPPPSATRPLPGPGTPLGSSSSCPSWPPSLPLALPLGVPSPSPPPSSASCGWTSSWPSSSHPRSASSPSKLCPSVWREPMASPSS